MELLLHKEYSTIKEKKKNLHSNMELLLPKFDKSTKLIDLLFTFQYGATSTI